MLWLPFREAEGSDGWPKEAAALIRDLKRRGLLDETIVVWAAIHDLHATMLYTAKSSKIC